MIYYFRNFFLLLFFLIPLFLVSGPAIPDISISFGVVFGILWFLLKERKHDLLQNNFIQLSILFWLSLFLISFFAVYKEKSFQEAFIYLRYLLIPICCYFIYFKSRTVFNYFLLFVLILVILVALDTLFQFFNYTSKDGFGSDLLGFKSDWYGRLTGPFGKELIPGSFLSKFGLIGFAYFLTSKKFNNKIILQSIYLSGILVVCFVSGERMAFATFLLALIFLLLFLTKKKLTIFISITLGLILIFAINKYHPFYNDYKVLESTEYHQGLKIEKYFQCDDGSSSICSETLKVQPSFIEVIKNFKTSAYGEIYLLSLEMFKNNPLTGIGLNNFKDLCENDQKYSRMMKNYNCASHPHNIYIQWLSEGGIFVFVIFVLYLFFLCNLIYKNDGEKNFKIISFAILIILFWPIMSTGSLMKNWFGISVYFIIGITMCLSRIKTNY